MSHNHDTRKNGTTWFVSRHPATIEWAKQRRLAIDRFVAHLETSEIDAGDTVIGTLPINLAAAVCRRGARYLHLALEAPAEWRGRELSGNELMIMSPRLESYRIEPVENDLFAGFKSEGWKSGW